jgi:ribonucleoside-triphosphate reductase
MRPAVRVTGAAAEASADPGQFNAIHMQEALDHLEMKAPNELTEGVRADAAVAAAAETAPAAAAVATAEDEGILLFKTPTCPNCKAAGALLDKAGIRYKVLNANEEPELVEKFGVRQAPTLVLVHDGGFEKFRGVSDIRGWLKNR